MRCPGAHTWHGTVLELAYVRLAGGANREWREADMGAGAGSNPCPRFLSIPVGERGFLDKLPVLPSHTW